MENLVLVHVGFAHCGTTSLQMNFFAQHPEIFLVSMLTPEYGGYFSHLINLEDSKCSIDYLKNRSAQIRKEAGSRTIVISNETMSSTPATNITACQISRDKIASRLRILFPDAYFLFTIRNQFDAIKSQYSVLLKNSFKLENMILPQFNFWLDRLFGHKDCRFLSSHDYYYIVDMYSMIFGREKILVLMLESLRESGSRDYLGKIAQFCGINLDDDQVNNYSAVRNMRLSLLEAVTIQSNRLPRICKIVLKYYINIVHKYFSGKARDFEPEYTKAEIDWITQYYAKGNCSLIEEYSLPLDRSNYPL